MVQEFKPKGPEEGKNLTCWEHRAMWGPELSVDFGIENWCCDPDPIGKCNQIYIQFLQIPCVTFACSLFRHGDEKVSKEKWFQVQRKKEWY